MQCWRRINQNANSIYFIFLFPTTTQNFTLLLVFSSQKQTNDIVKQFFLETPTHILNPSFLKANLFQKYTNAQPMYSRMKKTKKKNTPSFFVFYSGEFSCTCVQLALIIQARAYLLYPTHFKNKRFLLHS